MDFGTSDWNVDSVAETLTKNLFGRLHTQVSDKSRVKRKMPTEDPSPVKKHKPEKNSKRRRAEKIDTIDVNTCSTSTSINTKGKSGVKLDNKHKLKKKSHTGNVTEIQTHIKLGGKKKVHETPARKKNSLKINDANSVKMEETTNKTNAHTDTKSDKEDDDTIRTKKKRKRTCKKNKFKDYSEPCTEQAKHDDFNAATEINNKQKSGSNNVDVERNSNECSNEKHKKHKRKRKDEVNASESSLVSDPQIISTSNKMSMKQKISNHSDITVSRNKLPMNRIHKKGEKLPFNPEKLSAILSSKHTQVNRTKVPSEVADTAGTKKKDKAVQKKESGKSFLEKSRERLSSARFRYLNERLYTTTGGEAFRMFHEDVDAFRVYHAGFQGQVEKWPTNPVQLIVADILTKPRHFVVADFGCGDATIASSVPNKVHSFDLAALNDHVTVCDMSKVPLRDASVEVAVFCLSLMGTNLTDYLHEANRVLRQGGLLKIAEVTSRVASIGQFVLQVEKIGFKVIKQDSDNKMFVLIDFRKMKAAKKDKKDKSTSDIQLLPCVYKKR